MDHYFLLKDKWLKLFFLDQRASQDWSPIAGERFWEVLSIQDHGPEPHWDESRPSQIQDSGGVHGRHSAHLPQCLPYLWR